MPIPDFIVDLRAQVGHHPLWLSGVTAVVLRGTGDRAEVLLVRRSDDGRWTPVTGIIDPGEQPAVAAEREVLEEADVVAVAERLVRVHALPPMTYANGDRAQYLDLTFRCRWERGEPSPADGENTEAAFFRLDALPPLDDEMRGRLEAGLSQAEACAFDR
ncbi:NUDIX hydrolase [Cellulomonas marina]|uniref:ADP-ribose pyrophosphatase YjhB, NUDIX family n=1 Tax=Cellulomonas marina TaxID=988821 RepID=A0A1I0V7W7_9CELL|nr:NUDIX domain-containing protein [Cellulomonas marina]GIG28378.1 putative MutT/NUDIX-family protein [Cellulomonas marina]SFA72140.1 ADP-ribose pyrophosphatase YjhB, NUDIX family [Cellulomonas marina]